MTSSLCNLANALHRAEVAYLADAPLAPLTTFDIGGPAGILASPRDTDQVASCVRLANQHGEPYLPLGWGSNVLIADEGYPHLVISTREMRHLEVVGNFVRCYAGATVPDVANEAARHGLSGMERICDVPGTLGGGVYMNAGCDGVTLGDLLSGVTWVGPDGTVVAKPREELTMGYRQSEFMGTGRIITEVILRLATAREGDEVQREMQDVRATRKGKFPLDHPNCGSVFKRVEPEIARPWVEKDGNGAHSAGYYIERVGLKGKRLGNAQISQAHANFIVNLGGASAKDVLALVDLATTKVKQKYGIDLHREVNLIDATGRH